MARKTRLLFFVPLAVIIWAPIYARRSPALGPIPFIIWFQFAMVAVGCALTAIIYRIELARSEHGNNSETDDDPPQPSN